MFVSSYSPMLVVLAIRFDGATLRATCAGLAAVGLLYLAVVVGVVPRFSSARPYTLTEVTDASAEVAGYLASYLLPFVTVASPSARDLIGYAIYGLVVGVIFVRSDLARINPALYLVGYRVASVSVKDGGGRYLVCRRVPRAPREINAVEVGGLLIRRRDDR